MKKLLLILLLFCGMLAFSQPKKIGFQNITTHERVKKKGWHLLLKQIVSDSRCPEGVTCVWDGETAVMLSVYRDKKFVKDTTLTISSRHNVANKAWFSKYMEKNVQHIAVLPRPKNTETIKPKDYYLKIGYLKN